MIVVLDTSRRPEDYGEEFLVVDSVSALKELTSSVDALIIGDFTISGDNDESLQEFANAIGSVQKVVYVCPDDAEDSKIGGIVRGVGGTVEYNTDYLASSEGIRRLVRGENYGAVAMRSNVDILSSFLDNFDSGRLSRGQAMVLKNAVTGLVEDAHRRIETINRQSAEYYRLAASGDRVARQIKGNSKLAKATLSDLKVLLEKAQAERLSSGIQMPAGGNSILLYPRMSIERVSSRMTILIKDIGRTQYLTSFVLGMATYLSDHFSRDTKVLFLEPQGILYEEKYPTSVEEKRLFVNQGNYATTKDKAVITPVVHTSYPMKDNILNIISRPNYTGLIIVDRLDTDVLPLVTCDNVRPIYSASSAGWFGLRGRKMPWFTSIRDRGDKGALGYIPTIKGYSDMSPAERASAYGSDIMKDLYEKVIEAGKTK